MRFSPSFLDQIRERVPISDVIGRRVTWDKRKTQAAKGDYWACCPFHGEKTPSFHCENQKGRYHCFGCGVSGDHFRFMVELEGLSFPESVERLADEAGIPMPVADPRMIEREKAKATLYDVMNLATQYFKDQLQTAGGATARAYLRDRGLSQQVQQTFGLGFAPNNRNALKEYLASKDVPKEQVEACGLVVFGPEIAVSYDRFRGRIMFPIEDSRGRVIAFGGRALDPDVPAKYLNSPETELFSKGHVLYNQAKARKPANDVKSVIVCEGYMDVIALHAAGIENAVAPLGTALTENQMDMLWRMTPEPVLCFDGDQAGIRAAYRSVDLALPKLVSGRSLRFCLLPDGQDPDDVVKDGGKKAFDKLLEEAVPLHEFFVSRRLSEMNIERPEQKAAFEKLIYQDANSIVDEIVRKYYRSHVRMRLISLFSSEAKPVPAKVATEVSRKLDESRVVRTILGFLVEFPTLIADNIERIAELDFYSEPLRLFASDLQLLFVDFEDAAVSDVYDKLSGSFTFVLNAIHGDDKDKQVTNNRGKMVSSVHGIEGGTRVVDRGHQIKVLFPMISCNPPRELAQQTLNLLFLQIEVINIETEAQNKIEFETEEEFEAFQEMLQDARSRYADEERELDQSYHHWAGRRWIGEM